MKKKILSILLMFTIMVVSTISAIGLDVYAAYDYLFPVNNGGKIAYIYGYSDAYGGWHDGVDIHSSGDDTIYAAYSGVVGAVADSCWHVSCGYACEHYNTYGNYIRIDQDDGTKAYYGHLLQGSLKVSVGTRVVKGQAIASMGSSGYSTGKHLHFEIRNGSTKINTNPVSAGGSINYIYSGYGGTLPTPVYENISPGTYAIKNNNTGTYMCVSYGIDNNAQNVDMYSEINVASRMVISKASTGYKIRPECCASRIINPYGYTVTSGLNVNIYNDENDSSQWWQFQKVSGGYVIRNVQNPNCVLDIDGSNVYVSTYSGASTQIWSLVSNHTHSYGSWKVRKAATCTSGGTEYRTCSCGAEETRTTSALGHNYTSAITNPTCTSGGYTTYTCSRCYNSYTGNNTSAKGHSYGSWKVRKAATCTANGTEYRTCSCGAEETRTTSALGHNYTSAITNPTCTSGGYTTYTCSRCYNSYTGNNTSAKGHTAGDWMVVKEADFGVAGLKIQSCETCGTVLKRQTIPAPTYALGDANMDGDVNYLDYIVVKRQCMGTYKIPDEALIYADVDGSGKVDYMDYIMIKRHCMGTYVIK